MIQVTRKAYMKLKKHGELLIQDAKVPSTLRTKHKTALVFPSRGGKRTMTIGVKVLSRVKMEHHATGYCHLTVEKS
jgi:hypothetical protein